MEERIQNDRFHFQAETQRRDAGKQREREREVEGERKGKWWAVDGGQKKKKRQSSPAVCFLRPYIPQTLRRHGGSLRCKLLI